ncbi:MAG: SgcJ/EcaC family oxidoreductase [Thermodesulfobacteriota bacterium]
MRKIVLVAAALAAAFPASAQTGSDASKAQSAKPKEIQALGGLKSDLEEEAAIRKLYAQYTEAWNRHDVPAMVSFWAIDGDYMEPDGRHARGRDEVEKLFTQEHRTAFKGSTLSLTIETVWFITENVAMVDGKYDLSGVVDLQGKHLPVRTGHLTAILLREDGTWKVAAGRAMIPVPLVYREG